MCGLACCAKLTPVSDSPRAIQGLSVIAYRIADPGSVSPFEYFGIPISFCLGWLFFREAPFDDLFPGILLIVRAGITIIARERILSRRTDTNR